MARSILRRYPLQTGIPPKARFAHDDSGDDVVMLADRLVDYWWQRVVMEHPKAQKELVSVAKVVPIDKISDWLKWSYQFPWIVEEAKNVPLDDQKQTDQLVEALQALVQVLEHINSNAKKFNEVRNDLDEIVRGISSKKVGDWVKLCSLMHKHKEYLFLDGKPRQDVKEAIEGLNSFHAQYFQSWIHFYSLAARICIAKQFDETWKVWVKFLERFINWADGAGARELELVSFDEIIQSAVKLLEENPRIRRAEQVRLRTGYKTCGNTLRFFHRTPNSKVKITSKTSTLPNLDPEQYEKFWKERKAECNLPKEPPKVPNSIKNPAKDNLFH